MLLACRKIVIVIVEGPSDEEALGVALSHVYDPDTVYVHIMHGDITTRNGVNGNNVVSKIGNEIKGFASSRKYKKTDFKQIIHIVDTDGAFIPDENIIEESGLENNVYEDDGIHTLNVDGIIKRNAQKTENLDRLRRRGSIWDIPYRVYYMSCNLDHVLHNKRNSTNDEKESNAFTFAQMYKDDRDGFLDFICKSEFSVTGDYNESWKLMEKDLESLKRHTNLGIGLEEYRKEKETEECSNKGR
mgnify:CR=1 FL=1